MYIYSPSNGTNLGVMENAREVVVKITSDLGGFSGSFSIDDELKETFEVPGKAEGNVNLEVEEVELSPFEDTVSVDFSDETGTVEAASTDSSVATASVDGDQINITIQDNPQEDIDTSEDNLTSYDCHINLSLWWEDLFNGEHTITININADVTHGIPGDVATFTFTKTTEGTVIQRKWKKIGYKLNPVMDEIEAQQVILCDRQLHRICELEPVENLRYVLNELNKANEISFNYYKYVNNKHTNGFENEPEKYITCPGFDRLQDLSIVQVGNEYFEVAVTKSDDGSMKKSVSGISLGFAELSQLISTIAINTDEDLDDVQNFVPTIFYDETNQEHSLLHRILNDAAPHYQVGHVDDTLSKIQRTFSWENTDVISMLNEIGEEINCVFDIVVSRDTDGNATRIVNAYDLCYCKTCWNEVREQGQKAEGSADLYRNIVNGRCQHCEELGRNPYNLHDIGYITNVFLSTEHMANSITVNGNKDQIKNSFKIEGGDDLMTETVEGLNMTASNNITIFSPQTKKEMTIDLHNALDQYEIEYKELQPYYSKLLQTEYDILDLKQYLQSGRMPVSDETITDTKEALFDMINKFSSNEPGIGFNATVYVDKKGDGKGNGSSFSNAIAESTLRKMLTLYLPKGFSLEVHAEDSTTTFRGYIIVKKNTDAEDCYKLEIKDKNDTNALWKGKEYPQPDSYADNSKQSIVMGFKPRYLFAETYSSTKKAWEPDTEAFKNYIEQFCQMLINKNIPVYENERERDWSKYGYSRLKSYRDGYLECRDKMLELATTSETDWGRRTCAGIYCKYKYYAQDIQKQMDTIEDQYVALCLLNGDSESRMTNADGDYIYTWKSDRWKSLSRNDYMTIIQSLLTETPSGYLGNPIKKTETVKDYTVEFEIKNYTPSTYICDKPFKCKKCGSTNVATESGENVCLRVGCNGRGSDIYTYSDIVEEVVDFAKNDITSIPFTKFYTNETDLSLAILQRNIQEYFDLDPREVINGTRSENTTRNNSRLTLNQYHEMLSFIREDVYSNSNYTTEGLSNSEIIQQATELKNKATRELAKACIPQYTLQMQLSSILALEPIEWQGKTMNADFKNFCINNYVHVQIDEDIYRLRIASIELVYPMNDTVTVTFTDASRYLGGGMSDIASIIAQAESMATSYNYTANQAEKGVVANNIFQTIYNNGMDSALMNVLAARNQDIVIDQHGILLREMNEYTDQYSPFQMKLINRNIVMTSDDWQTASLAIGLGRLGVDRDQFGMPWNSRSERYNDRYKASDSTDLVYGVWADLLCGKLIAGENLVISNESTNVYIGKDGIAVENGYLDIASGNSRVVIDPGGQSMLTRNTPNNTKNPYLIYAQSGTGKGTETKTESDGGIVFYVDSFGNAFFAGKIWARSGHIANWSIGENELYTDGANFKNSGMYFGEKGLSISDKFYVTKNGDAYFDGEIRARRGYIGNWKIENNNLWNENSDACIYTDGHSSFTSTQLGFYLGKEGISLGNSFWVNQTGEMHVNNGYFTGHVEATSGFIGGFNIENGNLWRDQYVTANGGTGYEFLLNKNGLYMDRGKSIHINDGNYFCDNNQGYISGIVLAGNGSLYGESVNIMLPPGAKIGNTWGPGYNNKDFYKDFDGVHLALVPGEYASNSNGEYPMQLKLVGARKSFGTTYETGRNSSNPANIGIWQEGRLIVGAKDHCNWDKETKKKQAYKASIDGHLYVQGYIQCDFNVDVSEKPTRYRIDKKLKSDIKASDYVLVATPLGEVTENGASWN